MSRNALQTRMPWQDRWSQPNLEQLLTPLKIHHRRIFEHLIQFISGLSGVEQTIIWYGPAWKWTIHFAFTPGQGRPIGANRTLAYLVPRLEQPAVCIPLEEEVISQLPLPRFSKFVRDGIKMSKCAVTIHWATWTPTTQNEAIQLEDLLTRRHKLCNPK